MRKSYEVYREWDMWRERWRAGEISYDEYKKKRDELLEELEKIRENRVFIGPPAYRNERRPPDPYFDSMS